MVVYLVDTCVWRDFYENRISKSGSLIGKFAADFFLKVLKHKDNILYSEGLIKELRVDYDKDDVDDMLDMLIRCNVLKNIDIKKEEFFEAKQISEKRSLPFMDCLNAIQARNHNAILVTRDLHYFNKLKDIINAVRPEDVK